MSLTGIDRCRTYIKAYPCPQCWQENPETHNKCYELAYDRERFWCPTCHHFFNRVDLEGGA